MFVFILGTAGSGKTTLARNFYEYLRKNDDAILINLDPGNDLDSDIDVRSLIKVEDVMKKYGLGPNSAIIKSMELLNKNINKISEKVSNYNTYWKIVDTPGQLELFLYRDIGKDIIDEFSKLDKELAIIFLVDVEDVLKPENFVSILAWQTIISLRLQKESVVVINKSDKLDKITIEKLKQEILSKKPLEKLRKTIGMNIIISESFETFYEYSTIIKRPIFISALKKEGFEELEAVIRELFCACGDIS